MENSRIKVFLVEDEIVIREGIKRNINWGQEGFDFAGEASDGELAYPYYVCAVFTKAGRVWDLLEPES